MSSSSSSPASASSTASASASASSRPTSGSVDDSMLSAFVDASDRIVDKTLAQYADFARRRRRAGPAGPREWRRFASERGVDLFRERVETQRRPGDAREATVVSAFGGGKLVGTLDETLRGLYADSSAAVRANAAIQFGPRVVDCGVVRAFRTRSEARPHEFFGIKFVDRTSRIPGVEDQLCWVERMGTKRSVSGQDVGFHLLKAADWGQDEPERPGARAVRLSVCYLYSPSGPDSLDVFVRGIVEVPAVPQVAARSREKEAVRTAARYLLAVLRGRECERMNTIAQLIERSKTDREQLTACHCSKVIKGLSKMDMCSGCREAMRRPKLVALNDADERKHGSTAPSKGLEHLRLQSRLGSTRQDGELPEPPATASYRESESFRMFLPIHNARPESAYRAGRQQRDNVLLKMLRRHERKLQAARAAGSNASARTAATSSSTME